jgi:large subunit ribosomal protein L25
MAEEFDLIAAIREDVGKGASRRLRRSERVPAIIYGAGRPPRALTFDRNALLRKMEHEAFFSSVLTIKVGGKAQQAILKDVQVHPAQRAILHLDLQRIVADEKIRMTVPIHFLNEATATGVKEQGGTVAHLITEVEVNCLPKDLPEYLEIDIGELALDEMLYLSDLPLPEGVEILELAQEGVVQGRALVSIHHIKGVEEVEEVEEAEAGEEVEEAPTEEAAERGDEGE